MEHTEWGDLSAYLIGPLAGGVLGAVAYDAIARPRAVEVEPAQGALGDIEGCRDRAVELAAEPGQQGTSDTAGRRL